MSDSTKARATLAQLRDRYGFSHTSTDRQGVAIIRDVFGGGFERWVRVPGMGSGEKATYELEGKVATL